MSIARAAVIQCLQCPYCHSNRSILYGFHAVSLTVDDFGRLLQLGWCRCGSLIYRLDPSTRCCPQFSMRIRTQEFVHNAKQRKVIRKLSKQPAIRDLGQCLHSALRNLRLIRFSIDYPYPSWFLRPEKGAVRSNIVATLVDVLRPDGNRDLIRNQLQHLIVHELQRFPNVVLASLRFDGSGALLLKIAPDDRCSFCDCGADEDGDVRIDFLKTTTTSDDFLVPYWRTIRVDSEALDRWESTSKRPPRLRTIPSSACRKHPHHRWRGDSDRAFDDNVEIRMEPCRFSEEKFQLYMQYQVQVHGDNGDNMSRERFQESMVRSPIVSTGDGFGSFHRCYRRRDTGELIAFTLLDIVPDGVNSQYFVWSQQWRPLNLGIFSILDEIRLIEGRQSDGVLPFLYLVLGIGIYVEACSKMSYKRQFQPSELRTPSGWIPTEMALSRKEGDGRECDRWLDGAADLSCIPMEKISDDLVVQVNSRIATFGELRHGAKISNDQLWELYLFCQYVGIGLAGQFIYVLH